MTRASVKSSPMSDPRHPTTPATSDLRLALLHQKHSLEDHDEAYSTGTIRASTPVRDCSEKDAAITPVLPTPRGSASAASPPVPVVAPGPAPVKATVPLHDPVQLHCDQLQLHGDQLGLALRPVADRQLSDREKQWRHRNNVAVVIGDYAGVYQDELALHLGEHIEIISKDTVVSSRNIDIDWWTGRNDKGKIGIFPSACVRMASSSVDSADFGVLQEEYPLAIPCNEIDMKEVIGIGGFGKVHRAVYKGEDVAVKVAKNASLNSIKAVQDVITEAETFAHLAHDNVCALIGVVLEKDVCLVMEYAHGGALSDVLHGSKQAISLPTNVILSWSRQIASGMSYLHHETSPSLIHRDLKSSNILLSDEVDPANLHNNTIKITDFGLAREIEHTTHMSEAGTYPWMAPEVIRASDFSKKSDVWSFAVVLWELLTGERPYGGLNLFVVAYGVGHGTLSLPIPDGCPESLENLMSACWARNHTERPSFSEVLGELNRMEEDEFFSTTSDEVFRSIQSSWKGKIRERFQELKKVEVELKDRKKQLEKWWQMQDSKLKEKQAELKQKEEELVLKGELLERRLLQIAAETDKEAVEVAEKEQKNHSPKTKQKRISTLRRIFRLFSGPADVDSPSPTPDANHIRERRKDKRSSGNLRPSDLEQTRARLYGVGGVASSLECRESVPAFEKQTSMPHDYYGGHYRRRSNENLPLGNPRSPALATARRRSSSTTYVDPSLGVQQPPTAFQRVTMETERLTRALSDTIRPPSSPPLNSTPQLSSMSPRTMPASTTKSPSLRSKRGGSLRTAKPSALVYNNNRTSLDNSPCSPMMTADRSVLFDSGRHSMSSSVASGHSAGGELQMLIQLESPKPAPATSVFSFFDRSHDSALFDPYGTGTSKSPSPKVFSTPPGRKAPPPPLIAIPTAPVSYQKPPAAYDPIPLSPNSNIIRPRPRPTGLKFPPDSSLPISASASAPGSRAESPSTQCRGHTPSPTVSVQSLQLLPNTYTSEHTGGIGFASKSLDAAFTTRGFRADSESASVTSSFLDLDLCDMDVPPPLTPEYVDYSELEGGIGLDSEISASLHTDSESASITSSLLDLNCDDLDVPPPLKPEYAPQYVEYLMNPIISSLNRGMGTT